MRDRYLKYSLLLPAFVIVMATTFYPLAYSFVTSLREWKLARHRTPQGFVGLQNYAQAFSDETFLEALATTAIFVVASVVLTVVLSVLLALLLRRTGRLHTFTRIIIILPFAMSPALIGVSYRFMFNPEFGVLAKGIGALVPALDGVAWLATPTLAMTVLVLTDVWHWTPYMTFLCLGGLASIPRSTEEAAQIDGASSLRVFFDILLPQMRNVVLVVAVLKTIFALKMFDQVVTLTGGGPGRSTETLAYFVFNIGFKWYDMGYASALAYILTGIMMIVSIWYVRLLLADRKMATA
ncbi:MAG TPA: sugar ABC transporter permease [Hyphomicrobiaceae bacterium]|nr:sugar ABC transporter permease [Hyphomicrobiaceae bacterium]